MNRIQVAPQFCLRLASFTFALICLVAHGQPIAQITGAAAGCEGTTNSFSFVTDLTNGTPIYVWSITTNIANATILGATNQPTVQILAGTNGAYGLRCDVANNLTNATAHIIVTVLATATSAGLTNQTVCPGVVVTFATTPGGTGPFSFLWRKSGTLIPNATNSSVVLSNVVSADAGGYCVEVTGACGAATNCATLTVITAPPISCPTNLTVECPGNVPAPDTNLVSSVPTAAIYHLGDATATNGCELVITRTYAAVNSCNLTSVCAQVITVRDTTPPTINCASNRVVECSATWTFDTPTFSDACGTNVALTISGTTTNNHCGTTFTTTRTWLATDACGNTNSCSQTVDVVDTTAPVIACSSNIVVECTGPAGTPVSFGVTAVDACDTNVLVYSIPPSGTAFTLGTNNVYSFAVDSCHNTNSCSFTVTIIDTTPPTIVCPANIIAAEQPRDSGSAPVTYAAPIITDICDGGLALVTLPSSGFAFPVGTNTVHAVVTDDSGNTNACTFKVRVIAYRLYVTNHADAGPGTLRQALLDANDAPGENLVLFNLPGAGTHTIPLASPLPEITSPIIINGWSQPGFVNRPLVEVTGGFMSNRTDGLVINAGQSTVRGLILNGFATALRLVTNGNNVVQGNFIGTDASGTNAAANTGDGLYLACGPNLIGGNTNLAGNVLGGNNGSGIHLDGAAAMLNLLRGNFIGVGLNGTTPVGNGLDGVRLENGASQNVLGSLVTVITNVIAFNGRNGVTLEATTGSQNAILANLIHHNGALGIDLGNNGPTPDDTDDPDSGPNQLQNFPVLTDARFDGGLVIDGTLNSTPNANYRLDFYLNNTADPSGYGEGQFYLGSSFVPLNGSGTENFQVGFAASAVYTQFVTATVTDQAGNSSEFSLARQVRTPPVLESVPTTTNSAAGGSVTFCASASGTPPIFFQWRHNGANIPGATGQCYTIPLVEVGDGGNYSVVVFNVLGGSLTPPARLFLSVSNVLAAGDNFVDRVTITGQSGQLGAANLGATRETDEPLHAGKPGGKSVWYTWTSPITGIATLGTRGSDFDTLLGIYTGTNVAFLSAIGSDEDGGGAFTSGVRFNAIHDKQYHFAIDGYGGESGEFIFGWQMEDTPHLLPVITTQPLSQTVAPGGTVTFTIVAIRECGDGHMPCPNPTHYPHEQLPGLAVQWFFEGNLIPGETNYSLTISNVQPANVGKYTAQVTAKFDQDGVNRTVESAAADLQINVTGNGTESIQAKDKLLDSLLSNPWIIGNEPPSGLSALDASAAAASTVVRGYTGTQIFNTAGSSSSAAEDPICGVLGGSSEWITFVAVESGDLFLNTDGSSYDTVMAVFRRNPTNAAILTQIGCNNNGGLDGQDSSLTIPVTIGETNAILIDGVNGVSGTLKLNYSLVPKTSIAFLGITGDNKNSLRVSGRTNLNFNIQRSTNLLNWATIVTTNAPSGLFNYLDPVTGPKQFYRVQALP
ncbi:MAG: HYR domain-containing protein [Pedosphaera sp.]|nr:HYR domain-containing protein [Pedosphaera sp.]